MVPQWPFFIGRARLGAVQSLNLPLLVGAQDNGVLGRIQIQADDVFQFLHKLRIVAELEGSHPVRLQPMGAPDAPHAGRANAGGTCHGARGPVRGVGRLLVQRHLHHLLHAVVGDGARLARPRRILQKGRDAARQKAAPPPRYLLWRDPQSLCNLPVLQPVSSQQYDPRPLHQAGRQRALSRHTFQRDSLFGAQFNWGGYAHTLSSTVWTKRAHNR
jgi:hypothetical protein